MTRIISFTLFILSVGAAGAAQPKDLARERVQLLFKQVPVTQVLPALAKSLGYQLSLDPTLRALVTIEVENVTAETALNAICESIGCRWRREGARLIVETRTDVVTTLRPTQKGEEFQRRGSNLLGYTVSSLDDQLPFEITWSPVDLYSAFFMLARMANAQVDLAPPLQNRKLAVTIKEGSLRQAFDAVCAVADCRWELTDRPARIVRVTERLGAQAGPAAAIETGVYRLGEGVTSPVLLTETKPQYTAAAMRAKIQGSVWIEAVVLPDGSVGDARVVRSLDSEYGLDEEALKAARAWRFKPGMKNGHPVPVMVTIEMPFTLR